MTSSPFTQCPVLFEDADLLVINKPEGILSHPNPSPRVIPATAFGGVPSNGGKRFKRESPSGSPLNTRGDDKQRQGPVSAFEGPYDLGDRRFQTPQGPLWLIHRLDQDTSGVLLAAKNKKSVTACRNAFEERAVKKNYVALVSRRPMPAHGIWRDTLMERRSGGGVRSAVSTLGRPNAFLNYKVKENFPKFNLSLLEIELLTGKTHQIRVQSAYHGHPVAGDRIYGNFTLNKELKAGLGLDRMFLHAWRLTFPHPTSGKILEILSPLPEELENYLARCRGQRSTNNERNMR
jgi:23S rRNA-/tRNA-specific pseudouridylate synthase